MTNNFNSGSRSINAVLNSIWGLISFLLTGLLSFFYSIL